MSLVFKNNFVFTVCIATFFEVMDFMMEVRSLTKRWITCIIFTYNIIMIIHFDNVISSSTSSRSVCGWLSTLWLFCLIELLSLFSICCCTYIACLKWYYSSSSSSSFQSQLWSVLLYITLLISFISWNVTTHTLIYCFCSTWN